jgi:hypothetical protein
LAYATFSYSTRLALCSDANDLLGLRFDTRDPTDQEEADLPRSVFLQD